MSRLLAITPQLFLFGIVLSACGGANTRELPNRDEVNKQHKQQTPIAAKCQSWKPGQTIRIRKNTRISKGCNYRRVSFILDKDNVTFDCNGATLNGLNQSKPNAVFDAYSAANKPTNTAFLVRSSNIRIKNCIIINYVGGVIVDSRVPKDLHNKLRQRQNVSSIENNLRQQGPKNITVSNSKILDSHKHGVYLQRYVTRFSFINGEISNTGSSAIYFESGTRNNLIKNSRFANNGYINYKRDQRIRVPKFPTAEREAIAVDSSAYNKIVGNRFENNGKGAVFLYKNCFEKHQNKAQLPRFQHSNYNEISNNVFVNERYGVWLASRQSKQLSRFKCGDPLMYQVNNLLGKNKYYQDYARHNRVHNNTFSSVRYGVTVEDDHNSIVGNTFKSSSQVDIQVGTPYRSKALKKPVVVTAVENNIRSGRPVNIRYVNGSTANR